MKNFLTVLLAAVLLFSASVGLSGCTSREEIMAEYTAIFAKTPETDEAYEAMLEEAKTFLAANIGKVKEEDADYMLHLYIDSAKLVVEEDAEAFSSLIENYGSYASEMMQEILALELLEINSPLSSFDGSKPEDGIDLGDEKDSEIGGAAGISSFWREAMKRALALEKIVEEYKETLQSGSYEYLKTTIVWQYEYYINYMLLGTAECPVFEGEEHTFSEEAKEVYTELAQENPQTITAWAVNEFFDYLNSIRFKLDYGNDAEAAKVYYNTCSYIVGEAGKRLYE